ncbi:MAG: hypothetical protein ACOCG5_01990 [Candidatus Alkaliphilus sp. MAG34]|nr:hypothetical protein [Clostridiales bacterium]
MGKGINMFIKVGALIYVAYLLINKFIVQIPYVIAIPVLVLGIVLMITGIIKTCKR